MFSSKDLISFVFSNENDTYYGDDLLKRDLNQYLWERLHESYEAVYFLSAENDSFRVRSYGDIKCSEYTPKKKKMFGLLGSSSEQSELGNWLLRQLRAKPDSAAVFVCSLDDFCSVLSNPQWNEILEEISEGNKRTGIFVLTASATAENSANLLLTSPVFEKLHETAVTDLRDGTLRDLYHTLKKRKWDSCVFLNNFTWEQIHGLLLHLVVEHPDRFDNCDQLDVMSEYLYTCLRNPNFARDERLFSDVTIDECTMYEELYAWLKNERNWKNFESKATAFEKSEKKRTCANSTPTDVSVLRAPNSYAGRCLKINPPDWINKDAEAQEQIQSVLHSIRTEVSVPKTQVENKKIIEYAEKLLNQLDTVANGDTESYTFVLTALKFCVCNVYTPAEDEKSERVLALLQKKMDAIGVFAQHFTLQKNLRFAQLSTTEGTLQSVKIRQLKEQLNATKILKERYVDLIGAMELELNTPVKSEHFSSVMEDLRVEFENIEKKMAATMHDTPAEHIIEDDNPPPVTQEKHEPQPTPKEPEDDSEVFVLRDTDRSSIPLSSKW